VPEYVLDDIRIFRYRERMRISYSQIVGQLVPEPNEELEKAFLIWSLDDERAKLEAARHNFNQSHHS
jgi:hypothetical protein